MRTVNKALAVKTHWSPSAVKKLRGERSVEEFATLRGASLD